MGDFVKVSGLTAGDENGNIVGVGDMVEQARYIFSKIERILSYCDADLSHVVETVDYVTTLDGYNKTAGLRRELFGERFPASTGVVVAGLVRPDALIEIQATAWCGK